MDMWNRLEIRENEAVVLLNKNINTILKVLLFLIPLVCGIITVGVFCTVTQGWKYWIAIGCILFCTVYIFYYYPLQIKHTCLLQMNRNVLEFVVEPGVQCQIPVSAIVNILDRSVYYDFRDKGSRGWNHKIEVVVNNPRSVKYIGGDFQDASDRETGNMSAHIEINSIVLDHEEYCLLLNFMQKTAS